MRTTRVLAIAAILGIAFSFRASANVVYDSETTNEWFSVNMSTLTTEALKSSPWTPPSDDGEAKVESSVIKLDTDLGDPLTYTAVASEDVAIVAAEMTATVNASEPEFSSVPQAALCVIGTETATNWVGLVGTTENVAGYKWVTFSAPVPVAGKTYSVRIEFDQRQGLPRQIRYRVGDTVLGNGWYPNPKTTDAANIASVSFSGTGDISGLGGSNVVANAATFNGIGYLTFEAALDAAKAAGTGWNDANPIFLYKDETYTAVTGKAYFNCANGCTLTISGGVYEKNGNTYDITANDDCEAYADTTYYKTLEAALASGAGKTITINKHLQGERTIEITASLTLAINGMTVNCVQLTVAASATLTLDGNLAVATADINGAVAGGTLTVNGTLTGVNVEKLTFGDTASFTYNGATLAPTTLTLGNRLTITGLDNADIGTTVIDNVAVAGATLSKFAAAVKEGTELAIDGNQLKIVKATPDIEIEIDEDEAGYDFTNGTINVTTTVKSGKSGTLTLTVYDFNGTVRDQVSQGVSASGKVAFDLNDLTAGGTYSYTIAVSEDDKDLGTAYGEFTAANWGDVWFGADASKGEGQRVIGGKWAAEPTIENNAYYVIEDDSVFNVDAVRQDQGSNRVTRVDTKVTFESLVDGEVDKPEGEVIGGFVATTEGWKALANDVWVSLTGGPTPVAGKPYVVRAEVDFISNPKRARYLVSEDDGATFIPLANETAQWIDLATSTKSLLAQVELQGSGKVAKFEATVADKAVAVVDKVEYDTMAEALEAAGTNGTEKIELLTNATIEPTKKGKYEIVAGDLIKYVSGGDVASGDRTIIVDEPGQPPLVRPSEEVMVKVTAPGLENGFKDTDSLRKFLERNGVEAYTTKKDAVAKDISDALAETPQDANGLALWQDYALGIDKTVSVAPVTIPTGDADENNITLAIPAVDLKNYSGDYDITYKVGDETTEYTPQAIKIPLRLGTGTYSIKAIFTPADY